ncbi:MAG TPA: hypothetical protein VMH50_13820 [Thermoleophilia bacterium]|nr:hypothetical protein [Thermoleophilia bacterium]
MVGSFRSGWRGRLTLVLVGVAALLAVSLPVALGDTGTPTWKLKSYPSRGVDRSFKCDLYQEMPQVPRVLVYGGSRSLRMDPAVIKRMTGLPAFNFGFHNGRPEDAWAVTDWVLDTNPTKPPAVIWCVQATSLMDTPMNPGLIVDPRLSQAFPKALINAKMSWAMKQGVRNILHGRRYGFDGMLWWNGYDTRLAAGGTLRGALDGYLDAKMMSIAGNHLVPHHTRAMAYFERTIRLLNAYHIRPVIVIMPYQPRALNAFLSVGWGYKERWLRSYLKWLSGHLRIKVLDCLDISTFGGSPDGFYDGAHLDIPNSRLLLRYVVAHARACFKVPTLPAPTPSPTPSPTPTSTPSPTETPSPSPSPSPSAAPVQPVTAPPYVPVPENTDIPARYLD